MPKLSTINYQKAEPLKRLKFAVVNLITQGQFILAGAPKIGKPWLASYLSLDDGSRFRATQTHNFKDK